MKGCASTVWQWMTAARSMPGALIITVRPEKTPSISPSFYYYSTTYIYNPTPVAVNGLADIISISAGGGFNLAIDNNHNVWGWGNNSNGQLGDGNSVDLSQTALKQYTPVQTKGPGGQGYLDNIYSIATSSNQDAHYSLALDTNGNMWVWGYNSWGYLGLGDGETRTTPVCVMALNGVTAIAAGNSHTLAAAYAYSTPTTITLESSVNPSMYGTQVDFTATVNGIDTSTCGEVIFLGWDENYEEYYELDSANLDTSGQATISVPDIHPGTLQVKAVFTGDTNHQPATSDVLEQVVAPYPVEAALSPEGTDTREYFGYSVAIDENTAVVGAPRKNDRTGAAYVYTLDGDSWTRQAEITAGDAEEYDLFGQSVAVDGNTIVVGAPGKDDGAGAAYVFTMEGNTLIQQAELTADDGYYQDLFGNSVAIQETTAS